MKTISTLLIGKFVLLITLISFFSKAAAQDIKVLNYNLNDLVYVPKYDRIFITLGQSEKNANSVCKIDPYFGNIEECYSLNSEPDIITASDDGKYLYVGLLTVSQIIRIDLEEKRIDQTIELGVSDENLPLFAEDIVVMPGNANVIAVSLKNHCNCSRHHERLVIYDKGYIRPNYLDRYINNNKIIFGEDSTKLYGLNNENTGFNFNVMIVDSNGIKADSTYYNLLGGYSRSIEFANGKIYNDRGSVIDVTQASPVKIGALNLGVVSFINAVEPAPDSNVIYAITQEALLKTFDANNFSLISEFQVSTIFGNPQKMIHWGGEGKLAFWVREIERVPRQLYIIRNCTPSITEMPPVPTPQNPRACLGDTIELEAIAGYPIYYWSDGAMEQINPVTKSNAYSYAVPDANGCMSPFSFPTYAELQPLPPAPGISEPARKLCVGGVIDLKINYPNFFHTYKWSTDTVALGIRVTEPGTYSVLAISELGCVGPPSEPIIITPVAEPTPPKPYIAVDGATTFCAEFIGLTRLAVPPGFAHYYWSSGQNTPTIEVNAPGNYYLRLQNEAGCFSEYSDTIYFQTYTRPYKPLIIANENILASDYVNGNQWFLNGMPIPGATGQFYQATASGFYTVQVTDGGCTSEMSDLYNFTLTDVDDPATSNNIKVFPNPVTDMLHIVFDAMNTSKQIVELHDITGRIILHQKELTDTTTQLDISHLPAGIYVLQIRDKETRLLRKVQKITKL